MKFYTFSIWRYVLGPQVPPLTQSERLIHQNISNVFFYGAEFKFIPSIFKALNKKGQYFKHLVWISTKDTAYFQDATNNNPVHTTHATHQIQDVFIMRTSGNQSDSKIVLNRQSSKLLLL